MIRWSRFSVVCAAPACSCIRWVSFSQELKQQQQQQVYKGSGDATAPDRYRPICVTSVEYRILATAMAQRLAEVIHRLVGDSQIGFQIKRDIGENIDLMEEVLRYCNNEEGARARGGLCQDSQGDQREENASGECSAFRAPRDDGGGLGYGWNAAS